MAGILIPLFGLAGFFPGIAIGSQISATLSSILFTGAVAAVSAAVSGSVLYNNPPGPAGGSNAGENWGVAGLSLTVLCGSIGVIFGMGFGFLFYITGISSAFHTVVDTIYEVSGLNYFEEKYRSNVSDLKKGTNILWYVMEFARIFY